MSQEQGHKEQNRTFRGITKEEIHAKFAKFDEDGNGTLDKKELISFIAYNVKLQAMAGRGTSIPGVDKAEKLARHWKTW